MDEPNDFSPDWASPPGDTIQTILSEKGISVISFSAKTGLTLHEVQRLFVGSLPIDVNLAGKLSNVLGSTQRFWLARDAKYRSECVRLGKRPGED
jgi:HTH-type transcriptional regulator/antitoxin HigA